jgi:L-rhamnose mutarotase
MVLLNNTFLDNILDRGLKARYSENSEVFLTDLKNLLLSKNRLHLGKFVDNKCVEDSELSKVNGLFDSVEFSIEEDWDKLVNARITARNIIDKLIPDEKLDSERIKAIYWIGPNKTDDFKEDIVLETLDGKQYSFYLNKNISNQKSASFNLFADDLIGTDIDKLYKEEYLTKWDKLTQEWIKLLYENEKVLSHACSSFTNTEVGLYVTAGDITLE